MILTNLEQRTDWVQPGNVGNSGGPSSAANGKFVFTPAKPANFFAQGAEPYNNGYWYVNLGAFDTMTYFAYRLGFEFPTATDLADCQAIEFELQQNVGSHIYNMAWQADIKGSGVWRAFNYSTSTWEPTTIPVVFKVGELVDIEVTFLRGGDTTLTHLGLRINGNLTVVNITREATAKTESDYVHAAFQIDTIDPTKPINVVPRYMSVSMLPTTT